MKITNVKVETFNWPTENWQVGFGMRFRGTSALSVVTVETDQGEKGNAFLNRPTHNAPGLIEFLKPIVMGRNPLDIGAIWWDTVSYTHLTLPTILLV